MKSNENEIMPAKEAEQPLQSSDATPQEELNTAETELLSGGGLTLNHNQTLYL
jgi:hypothetical protein